MQSPTYTKSRLQNSFKKLREIQDRFPVEDTLWTKD